ncbi:MAG: hypothetical protein J6X70_02290 [Muribaculaceae bacterium]|nr:hypothetical protein [Muribaculaceae bacterium]
MKRRVFSVKKMIARALVMTGALWGLTACHSSKKAAKDPMRPNRPYNNPNEPQPLVYGPPPGLYNDPRNIDPLPDVYGPPPEVIIDNDTVRAVLEK